MNPQKVDRQQLDKELLRYFLEHEMQIRRENPSLFWQIIAQLTTSPTLTNCPCKSAGAFLYSAI